MNSSPETIVVLLGTLVSGAFAVLNGLIHYFARRRQYEFAALRQTCATQAAMIAAASERLDRMDEKLTDSEQDRDGLRNRLQALMLEQEYLRREHAELKASNERLTSEHAALKQSNEQLMRDHAALKEENVALRRQQAQDRADSASPSPAPAAGPAPRSAGGRDRKYPNRP